MNAITISMIEQIEVYCLRLKAPPYEVTECTPDIILPTGQKTLTHQRLVYKY